MYQTNTSEIKHERNHVIKHTLKLVYKDHPRDQQYVVLIHGWSLYASWIIWKVYTWGPVKCGFYKQVVFKYRWPLELVSLYCLTCELLFIVHCAVLHELPDVLGTSQDQAITCDSKATNHLRYHTRKHTKQCWHEYTTGFSQFYLFYFIFPLLSCGLTAWCDGMGQLSKLFFGPGKLSSYMCFGKHKCECTKWVAGPMLISVCSLWYIRTAR